MVVCDYPLKRILMRGLEGGGTEEEGRRSRSEETITVKEPREDKDKKKGKRIPWKRRRRVPWKRRRRTVQVITGTFPCGKWLHKIKNRPTSECERCKKAWMAAGKTGAVPDETVGHIQSVQCVSQEEVVPR